MPKRVLIAEFKHETNVFAAVLTDIKAFESRYLRLAPDVMPFFEGVKTEMGGFMDACRKAGIELIPAIAANATPGGKVTQETFDFVLGHILDVLSKNTVDGILLSLHGAMVYQGGMDGEGDLLKRIRDHVGPELPIICTLDLHANITDAMMEHATAMIGYDCYPHVDIYERALEAANMMAGVLAGKVRPVMRLKRVPILCPYIASAEEPVAGHLAKVHTWEQEANTLTATLFHGFFHADIPDSRMSVLAVTNNDPQLAQRIVDDVAKGLLKDYTRFTNKMPSAREAIARGMQAPKGPVVIAETADNPGVGGSGDTTHMLAALMEMKAKNVGFAMMVDPETIQQAAKAGIGAKIRVRLGGKSEALNGKPVEGEAVVKNITDGVFHNTGPMWNGLRIDCGATVVLEMNGIEVIVCTERLQPLDPEIFRKNGIKPEEKQIIVVKSTLHFKAAYDGIASEIIFEDGPGLASQTPANFPIENIRRPVFPLDAIDV